MIVLSIPSSMFPLNISWSESVTKKKNQVLLVLATRECFDTRTFLLSHEGNVSTLYQFDTLLKSGVYLS